MDAPKRPVAVRIRDWRVTAEAPSTDQVRAQANRCMDCGVPFCHGGCPLGNRIPRWNELVARDHWREAIESLHATNNFPEFTGWLCPAPCEPACVLAIDDDPVTIKQVELAIIDRAFAEGWVAPQPAPVRTGHAVAVIGSGPAGLAAAQQLARVGHDVTIFERDDRAGGLLRYGIPDFKMDKALVDRRLEQLRAEGVVIRCGVEVGADVSAAELDERFDAVVIACGAAQQRELDLPGRELEGIHLAMRYLTPANRVQAGDLAAPPIDAHGHQVVIIGGGDTAADCLGTANRQGATEVRQLDHNPLPPEQRDEETNPWPRWPRIHRLSPAHEEGVVEEWAAQTTAFVGNDAGRVRAVQGRRVRKRMVDGRRVFEPVPGSDFEMPADLVLIAAGFVGVEPGPLVTALGVAVEPACGTIRVDEQWRTSRPGVYACGDATRGASLVVWAIADGRACAAAVDADLMGSGRLPAPVGPYDDPW